MSRAQYGAYKGALGFSVLDWSMDYSYQPVDISHKHGSVEGSLLLLVNGKA